MNPVIIRLITSIVTSKKGRNGIKNLVIIVSCVFGLPFLLISGAKHKVNENKDKVAEVIAELKEEKKIDNSLSVDLVISVELHVHSTKNIQDPLDKTKVKKHMIEDYIKQERVLVEVENEDGTMTVEEREVSMFKTKREIFDMIKEKYQINEKQIKDIEMFIMSNMLLSVTAYTGEFFLPSKSGKVSCSYRCYENHLGTDIASNVQTEILASASGTVIFANNGCMDGDSSCGGGFGNHVVIAHNINGIEYVTIYAHMIETTVTKAQKVMTGTTIGFMGNTGRSEGVHVHFEIIKDVQHFPSKSERYVLGVDTETIIEYPESW